MQYTLLGSTGVRVSRLCFGTMSFGNEADEQASAALFARCLEAGVNFFDCADVYSKGRSEEILGRLIAGRRDELVITSKVGMGAPGGLSRRHILMRVEQSLRRLGTDRLDVYFCHRFDEHTPVEQTLEAMDQLVRSGKVLYLGVSNWASWQVAMALGTSALRGLAAIQVLQPMYNLLKRTAQIELLPLAADRRLGVITYSPLAGGLLTGKYAGPDDARKPPAPGDATAGRFHTSQMYQKRYREAANFEIARELAALARQWGMHPATAAVAWAKSHPAVTAPIIGARNLEQLEASLAAGDLDLSADQRRQISDLTPPVPPYHDRTE